MPRETYMKVVKLAPAAAIDISLSARVSGVYLRPDGQVEIFYQVAGCVNTDSIVVNATRATEILGARWEDR